MSQRTIFWLALLLLPPVQALAQGLPTYTITAQGGRLSPDRLEVAPGKIKLIVHNAGQVPIEFEHLGLRVEKVLAPGATSFVVTPPLRPGQYEFIDEFHPETGRLLLVVK